MVDVILSILFFVLCIAVAVGIVVGFVLWVNMAFEYSYTKRGGSNYETPGTLGWAFGERGAKRYRYKKAMGQIRAAEKKRREELRATRRAAKIASRALPASAEAMNGLGAAAEKATESVSDYANFLKAHQDSVDARIDELRRRTRT